MVLLKSQQRKAKPKAKEEKLHKSKLSKYIKKPPKSAQTKRDNTYVFEGFYERLKQVDVKHANSLESAFTYDRLLEQSDLAGDEEELFKSNFIQLLRSEKANNKTVEFAKVYNDVERFCYSYPLLVHNKTKIIERLLHYLEQPDTVKIVQTGVIDLFIALIKDFRTDIYQDFLTLILPRVISSLDISNVQLLDKIFTLISFSVKYLTRSIKEDLPIFYSTYSELLSHKNKFVRKFSAQAFCYVVRKLPLQGALLETILKPLMEAKDRVLDHVLGVSELLFEVAYGAGEGLHSKAKEVMVQVLCIERSEKTRLVIRCMFQKLVNEVDTEKHQEIYDTLTQTLDWKADQGDLGILLDIFRDNIKLKFGRRVPHYGIASITECLNHLLHSSQISKTQAYPLDLKISLAETMAVFYYFKFNMILGLFQKSQMEFSTAKHLFNHNIYSLPTNEDTLPIIIAYFNLFIHSPAQVADVVYEKRAGEVDWTKLLGLRQSQNNQMEYTTESHRNKLKQLIKSYNQYLLKKVQDKGISNSVKIELIAIFERLAAQLGDHIVIDLAAKYKEDLEKSIFALFSEGQSTTEQFVLYRFLSRCRVTQAGYLFTNIKKLGLAKAQDVKFALFREELDESILSNMVIKNYNISQQDIDELKTTTQELMELQNIGRVENIPTQIAALKATFIQRNSTGKINDKDILALVQQKPDDIVVLRAFNSLPIEKPYAVSEHTEIFNSLSQNLLKNQRDVRLQTLRALNHKFEKLDSKLSTEELPLKCDILENILACEEQELTFKTEKAKLLQIDRVKAQLENDSVPEEYLLPVFNYLIGTFWVRFTPLFDRLQQTIRVLMRENSATFAPKLFSLLKNVNYLTQLAHSNTELTTTLIKPVQNVSEKSMVLTAYLSETKLEEDFMDVKDFFYNIAKSMCMQTVFEDKKLRVKFFNELFYPFIENEYTVLNFPQNTKKTGDILDRMTLSNMVDSEAFKSFRRQAYTKMYAFIELLTQSESLTKSPRVADLQKLMLRMLNTSDTKLQKYVLDVLLKTDSHGVLRTYRKMLDGFTDDIKFKDMIQVMNFGSNISNATGQITADNEDQGKQEKNLPKVAKEHRLQVLPVVVKLLLSKLVKKKGQIKQKTVHQRRHIVYQFMSSLAEDDEEMQVFMDEMLFSIGIQIAEEIPSQEELRERLSCASFSGYLNFIGSVEVIIKQMGSQLVTNGYLNRLAAIFTEILFLTKVFTKHLKLSLAEQKSVFDEPLIKETEEVKSEVEDSDIDSDEEMPEAEDTAVVSTKDALYRFVGHQSKMCLKKGLSLIKQLYSKYSNLPSFLTSFTSQLNTALIQDLLPTFSTNYITDRSQLIEVLTLSWSQYNPISYVEYPQVMESLLGMLTESKIQPEVYETILQMLKNIILKCSENGNLGVHFLVRKANENEEEDQEMESETSKVEREQAQKVMSTFVIQIADSLQKFSTNHLNELKNTLILKTSMNKKQQKVNVPRKHNAHEIKNQTIKDLIFVMSEIAKHLPAGDSHNQNFLEMIISVLSMKNLHQSDYATSYYEELLQFGVSSLASIFDKLPTVALTQTALIDKLFQLFLLLRSLRIRNTLAQSLQTCKLNTVVKPDVLQIVSDLNRLKRGAADLELDYDCVIKTIERTIEGQGQLEATLTEVELQAITYSIVHLMQSEEFSVRDFACHYVKQVLLDRCFKTKPSLQLLGVIEGCLLRNVGRVGDEMVLKSVLDVLRHYISYLKNHEELLNGIGFKSSLTCLSPLVNLKDDNDDFFASFLAIKMKNRQKALRMLGSRLESIASYKAINAIAMPMVNYIIFGDKSQKTNRRNTITYSREEKRGTLEEALNVYQSLSLTLPWPDYFRLLKTLLFKLNRVTARQSLAKTDNSVDEDLLSQEKIVVKCICRVLNGFHFDGIQDALSVYLEKGDTMLPQVTEDNLGQELEEVFKAIENEEEVEGESEQEVAMEIDEVEQAHITDIQQKIYQKVLPILERHMFDAPTAVEKKGKDDKPETPTIRSYVVVSIMKAIRKLPLGIFQNQFRKLVSTIVSKGLRQRDIACRDKGRKALLKLAEELTPRPLILHVIFSELKDQLQKAGYQLHTFVFTVHFLLQQLHERKLLLSADISTPIIEMLGEKFLEELFLSNSGVDGALEDMEKVKIKESKSKKAIPVFEMFAQYMDFKQSFFSLIAPVVKTLEENPTITKIQMCEELLNRLSNSLMRNESVKKEELLMFLYTIIQRGVTMAVKVKINGDKGVERDYGAKVRDVFVKTKKEYKEMTYSVEMRWKKTGQQMSDKKTQEICGRVLGSFGLQCIKRALKSTSLILKPVKGEEEISQEDVGEELRAQLDPFVPLLLEAFRTYHNPIIVTTLHVLGQLIPLNLPTFRELMKKFLNKIFKLFDTTSSSSDLDFLNSLFRCTSELIRTYATYQDLSAPQIKTLVSIIRQHIGTASTQGNVFQCLKAIVYRKVMSADLYDLIEQVQELMITSIAKSTRSVCASIFTQFLLEYPLEQTRVEQHVNHLLKNLGYFDSEGRMQVLDVVNSLIERFPKELLDQYAELIFFTLVLRSVNESNPKVRERVLQVIKRLTAKCSPAKAKTLFNTVTHMQTSLTDSESKRFQLSQAKQLILGVFIEKGENAQQIYEQCISLVQEEAIKLVEENERYLENKKQQEESDEDEYDDGVKNQEMKGFLKNIELLEDETEVKKQQQQHLVNFEEEKHLAHWSPLYYALLNLETLFTSEETQQLINLVKRKGNLQNLLPNLLLVGLHHKTYWIRMGVQRVYGALFSLQIKCGDKVPQFLESKGDVMYKLASNFKFRPMLTDELGTQLVKNLTFLLKSVIESGEEVSLPKYFSRLSFLARKLMLNVNEAKDRIAHVLLYFQVSLHLFSQQSNDTLDNPHSRSVLTPILELVYRVYTDEQYAESRAKELAFELVDQLSAGMDKAFFVQAYNSVKQGIVQKRMQRKKQQKIVMASAEGARMKEQRRTRKAEKKRQQKKDKRLQMELRKK
ncbi:hypothetical protein FGO68_gene14880 [Halteria grandinella]|uniref:Uncharacterized protein n=1 Tax=Halteria grandinella TaxID=5974 RepID=A0A8J8P8Q7_HALGN|nr:hypothetical protein FGO68_gene14880 [Halteria grandinella]